MALFKTHRRRTATRGRLPEPTPRRGAKEAAEMRTRMAQTRGVDTLLWCVPFESRVQHDPFNCFPTPPTHRVLRPPWLYTFPSVLVLHTSSKVELRTANVERAAPADTVALLVQVVQSCSVRAL